MPGLFGVEKLAAIYVGLTLLLTCVYISDMEGGVLLSVVGGRVMIAAATWMLYRLYRYHPCHATYQLRVLFQIILLGYWYPDIYHFVSMMPNQDHLLAEIEQKIFGCQPALLFSQVMSGAFWRELFCFGYFSYFPMIALLVMLVIVKRPRRFDSVTFVVMSTFFLYYIIYLLFNAAGPQFYFNAPGVDAANGVFPFVDDWFSYHKELKTDYSGPFSYLVYVMHGGEAPIAAFPSSHVGVSTVVLILTFRLKKRWGLMMLPFYVLLCLSTVYIGAHYAIDVLAGWVSAIVFFIISRKLYKSKLFHRPEGFDSLHRYGHHHRKRRHHYRRA